jgi:hypothetical protein
MPVVIGKNDTKTIPICCGEEMRIAGRWFHCFKCGLKLIQVQDNKLKPIVAELLNDIVRDYEMPWKELYSAIHPVWKNSLYDEYFEDIPEDWIQC